MNEMQVNRKSSWVFFLIPEGGTQPVLACLVDVTLNVEHD